MIKGVDARLRLEGILKFIWESNEEVSIRLSIKLGKNN